MHREDGSYVRLIDVLKKVPSNDWLWSVLEYDGIGLVPYLGGVESFERDVASRETGYHFSWNGLCEFSEGLAQTIECSVVAVADEGLLKGIRQDWDYSARCKLAIEAFDSTEWTIWADKNIDGVEKIVSAVN